MMDSQENILEHEEKQEVIQEAGAPEVVNVEEVQPRKVYETKAEVLRRVQDIAHGDECTSPSAGVSARTAISIRRSPAGGGTHRISNCTRRLCAPKRPGVGTRSRPHVI